MVHYCAVAALASCVTNIYGAVGVFGVYSDLEFVEAWPWWIFQTTMRLEEVAMSALVAMLAGKAGKDGMWKLIRILREATRRCATRIQRKRFSTRVVPVSVKSPQDAGSSGSTERMFLSENNSITIGASALSDIRSERRRPSVMQPLQEGKLPVVSQL